MWCNDKFLLWSFWEFGFCFDSVKCKNGCVLKYIVRNVVLFIWFINDSFFLKIFLRFNYNLIEKLILKKRGYYLNKNEILYFFFFDKYVLKLF